MSVRPSNIPPIQEVAPAGGYAKVDMARIFPKRGPAGWQLWSGSAVMILYGFYQVGQTNQQRNEQKYLERQARYAVAPILQAEADRAYLEQELINLKREAEIMKDVEGWVVGENPYITKKWYPRTMDPFNARCK